MTEKEKGFLLLTSELGDISRNPLTPAQFRKLARRVTDAQIQFSDRDIRANDIVQLGYSRDFSERIVKLLSDTTLLEHYCAEGDRCRCTPITRIHPQYPRVLRHRLGLDAPGCLWMKGDLDILQYPAISLVGSRDLLGENRRFAEKVGFMAANKGFVLVSGNARGADQVSQEACIQAGGKVISVVADELWHHPDREGILYISENGYDLCFSAQRAHSRNRVIHSLGVVTFVAQSSFGSGGTWTGTTQNLSKGWSPVGCFDDGSIAANKMIALGALAVSLSDLDNMDKLLVELFNTKGLF